MVKTVRFPSLIACCLLIYSANILRAASSTPAELTDDEKGDMMIKIVAAPDWPDAVAMETTSGVITWTCVVDTKLEDEAGNSTTYKITEKVVNRRAGKKDSLNYQIDGEIVDVLQHTTNDGKPCRHVTTFPIHLVVNKPNNDFKAPDLMVNKKTGLARFHIAMPTPFPAPKATMKDSGICGAPQWGENSYVGWVMEVTPQPNYGAVKSRVSDMLNRWKPKHVGEMGGYFETPFPNNSTHGTATLNVQSLCWKDLVPAKITVEWQLSAQPKK